MKRLGVKARFIPARLAIARSLASQGQPAPLPESVDWGKSIKGDTLFGVGATLSAWLGLVVQKNGGGVAEIRQLISLVGAHWRRGLQLLDTEWKQSNEHEVQFVRRLVEVAGLPLGQPGRRSGAFVDPAVLSGEIGVPVGEISLDAGTNAPIRWIMNGPGGSPHSAIMGGVGSGKTRSAVAMLRAIRERSAAPFLAFDFKGDLGTDAEGNGYHLERTFGAEILSPPRQSIPLNVLSVRDRKGDPYAITHAALRFRESFAHLKGTKLGDKQKGNLTEALERALRLLDTCELTDVKVALRRVYEEKGLDEDGATAALDEICRFPLFSPEMEPEEFFSKSWIIRLPQDVPEVCRGIIVNLMLDALDSYLNSLTDAPISDDQHRALRVICVIDEAHRILGTRLPALSSLVRMSRSKGGAIMLISQSPADFSGEEDEFLSEMGLVASFASNAPASAVTRIFGKGANLAKLSVGQCWVKLRGDDSAKRAVAWTP